MKVKDFYLRSCEDKKFYKSLQDNKYGLVIYEAICILCQELKNGASHSSILETLHQYFLSSVEDDWFTFSWQKEQETLDWVSKFERFLNWIGNVVVLDTDVDVAIPFRSDCLQSRVNLIVQYENGTFGAINLFKGMSKKSMSGRSLHTSMKTDLYALVAKKVLENHYPGIIVSNVYLTHENDNMGNILPDFEISGKRSSNIYSLNFKEYYEKDSFQHQKMLDTIAEVVKTPLQPSCYGCVHERLCKTTKTELLCMDSEEITDSSYQLPLFSDIQKEVINHREGPCLVLAGPGSGKTAVLTGRIHSLIESGVDADYILAITFTRDAAAEIKDRVASFTKELPYISTIHALCYDILKKNGSRVGMDVKLLGNKERLSIIESMLEAFEPLQGFNYSLIDGNQGLLKTVERKLDKFLISFHSDAEAFLQDEKNLGYDFITFAQCYEQLCISKGYISFTQQISLCVKVFKEYPEVLEAYRHMFKYIMVDEFQDIDSAQAELIYLLAEHQNLLVVGDDDQSIYGFRGGSHKYMLEFKESFPNAKTYRLRENYRSTSCLVQAAQSVINVNTDRISKEIISGRKEEGIEPILIPEKSAAKVDEIIRETLKTGYEPKDIAVLSVKNATLEELALGLTVPAIVDKQCLVNDCFFSLLQTTLELHTSRLQNTYSFCHYLKLYGIENEKIKNVIGTSYEDILDGDYMLSKDEDVLYTALRLLHFCFKELGDVQIYTSPAFFVQFFSHAAGMEDALALPLILELMEEKGIGTIEELRNMLTGMVRFQDETRLDVSEINAVHLITNHESKGREFKIVLLIDDFKSEVTEEQRRLYYVAMTRAKDVLYICYDGNAPSITNKIMKGSET